MLFVVAGDAHGRLERLYADVLAFERALGRVFAHVLHVGDFGIWPEPERLDRATRAHDGAGDFPAWFAEGRPMPRPTTFIQGNHEDFAWLDHRAGTELLPGLRHMKNGSVITVEIGSCDIASSQARETASLRIGGVGGCYGRTSYEATSQLGRAPRHYTRDDLARLSAPLDVVLFHDAPKGIEFVKNMRDGGERRYASQAEGLSETLARIRPKLCFFGHHHARVDAVIEGVRCVGLNAVGYPGSLVAFEADGAAVEVVGEFPETISTAQVP